MKGMLNFLERAGLIKTETSVDGAPLDVALDHPDAAPVVAAPDAAAPITLAEPSNFDDIYLSQGVAPARYPAERLLRLVDGLSAMDEATRQMAIKAMDAADESWTIDDPLADASAKVRALATHGAALQSNLRQIEQETQASLNALAARKDKVVGDIRVQIAELEALVSRELTRFAQETAAQEASLKAAQDQVSRELASMAQVSGRLLALTQQFASSQSTAQE